LASATGAFAVALVAQPGPLALAMGLATLLATLLNHQCGWTTDTLRWARRARGYVARTCTQLPNDLLASGRRVPEVMAAGDHRVLRLLRHWAWPLLFGAVFVWLFSVGSGDRGLDDRASGAAGPRRLAGRACRARSIGRR
jgi:hypothetical protein